MSCSGNFFKGHYHNFATQEVTSSRALFVKPLENYKALSFYGPNIVVSEHENWKKYKKISAPAFSEVSPLCTWGSRSHINMIFFFLAQQQASLGGDH